MGQGGSRWLTTEDFWQQYERGQRRFENVTISGGGSLSLAGKNLPRLVLYHVQFSEVDLTEAILDGAVFVGVSTHGARFQGISLRGGQLQEIEWRDSDLSGVNLQRATLMHAQLQYARLVGADLRRAILTAANLRGANLVGADLRETQCQYAVLEEITADATTQWPDDRALKGVRLAFGQTLAQITGRLRAVQTAAQSSEKRYTLPGTNSTASFTQIQKAILKDWRTRPEQPAFRAEVVRLFRGRCAISEANQLEGLEAAHIIPHIVASQEYKRSGLNGILLRADLHRLFDAGKLTIDPDTLLIELDTDLQQAPAYQQWHRATLVQLPDVIQLPLFQQHDPWRENLRWRQLYYQDFLDNGKLLS
ncbi:MAG TPA: pentapeptide repeat-containing protein [Ktedonobacteraceae bacterium]|nr:pentapeptide repeat-containing protein [Ktedonobacteraceae bacterium]